MSVQYIFSIHNITLNSLAVMCITRMTLSMQELTIICVCDITLENGLSRAIALLVYVVKVKFLIFKIIITSARVIPC